MAQHDYVIANGTGAAVRSDLNNALAAIVSQNSGTTEPATTYAYQWWADTTTGLLKLRNGANNAWITLRELDGTLTIEAGTVSAPGLAFASDLNTGVWSPGADQFAIATNGVERVEWGTSEVVFNDGGENYDFRIEGDTNSSLFFVDASADTVEINGDVTITDKIIHSGDTDTAIRFPAADTVALETNNARRLTVYSDGNISVGPRTTTPGELLALETATGSSLSLGHSGQGRWIVATDNANLKISDLNGEKARIDSSGRLLVGVVVSPSYQLQLSTDSAGKPSTNTWTIVSDERIKEEIELADLDLCYEAVKNIPLKRFKWKDEVYTEEQAYDRRKLGWIAQDVEAVFPKAVRQHEFKYNQIFEEVIVPAVPAELDEDGNVIIEEQPERIEKGELISEEVIEDCRDLNSDQLYAAMYGAIQKLISKVETLEAEIAALKA